MLQEEKVGVPVLEDQRIRDVNVISGCYHGDAVFYTTAVTNGFTSWFISKRYSHFETLHNALMLQFQSKMGDIIFPPKQVKILFSHASKEFIDERKVLLNNYLKKCISFPEIGKCKEFSDFFTSDRIDGDLDTPLRNPFYVPSLQEMPDDVEVTDVTISSVRYMHDHVLFQCDVLNIRKRKTFQNWTVLKRFGQFHDMDTLLREDFKGHAIVNYLPTLPSRKLKLLENHLDPAFVEIRRALLEHYIKYLIRMTEAIRNKHVLEFLGAA